jgi:hypothetical protein
MARKTLPKAERAERDARHERVLANANRTRALGPGMSPERERSRSLLADRRARLERAHRWAVPVDRRPDGR